jgi:hypothetical protein
VGERSSDGVGYASQRWVHGAGKTTTIKTLLGFRKPDGGAPTNFLVCLVSAVLPLLAAL